MDKRSGKIYPVTSDEQAKALEETMNKAVALARDLANQRDQLRAENERLTIEIDTFEECGRSKQDVFLINDLHNKLAKYRAENADLKSVLEQTDSLRHKANALEIEAREVCDQLHAENLRLRFLTDGSDVCCCGDSMKNHQNPMDAGHMPVSMLDDYVGSLELKYEKCKAENETLRAGLKEWPCACREIDGHRDACIPCQLLSGVGRTND